LKLAKTKTLARGFAPKIDGPCKENAGHLQALEGRLALGTGVLPRAFRMMIGAPQMTIAALMFRLAPSVARCVSGIAALIAAEYVRAVLAASHYERLKRRDVAGLGRRRIGVGGIPRAVFETHYARGSIANRSRHVAGQSEEEGKPL
jgi:hypothetical protein